jgi:c-di-AMP phosphodiesterase-like protein
MVISFIRVDNYADIMQSVDEEVQLNLNVAVRGGINE